MNQKQPVILGELVRLATRDFVETKDWIAYRNLTKNGVNPSNDYIISKINRNFFVLKDILGSTFSVPNSMSKYLLPHVDRYEYWYLKEDVDIKDIEFYSYSSLTEEDIDSRIIKTVKMSNGYTVYSPMGKCVCTREFKHIEDNFIKFTPFDNLTKKLGFYQSITDEELYVTMMTLAVDIHDKELFEEYREKLNNLSSAKEIQ